MLNNSILEKELSILSNSLIHRKIDFKFQTYDPMNPTKGEIQTSYVGLENNMYDVNFNLMRIKIDTNLADADARRIARSHVYHECHHILYPLTDNKINALQRANPFLARMSNILQDAKINKKLRSKYPEAASNYPMDYKYYRKLNIGRLVNKRDPVARLTFGSILYVDLLNIPYDKVKKVFFKEDELDFWVKDVEPLYLDFMDIDLDADHAGATELLYEILSKIDNYMRDRNEEEKKKEKEKSQKENDEDGEEEKQEGDQEGDDDSGSDSSDSSDSDGSDSESDDSNSDSSDSNSDNSDSKDSDPESDSEAKDSEDSKSDDDDSDQEKDSKSQSTDSEDIPEAKKSESSSNKTKRSSDAKIRYKNIIPFNTLKKELPKIFSKGIKTSYVGNQKRGVLDNNKLWKHGVSSSIFMKKIQTEEKQSLNLSVWVDNSGSMDFRDDINGVSISNRNLSLLFFQQLEEAIVKNNYDVNISLDLFDDKDISLIKENGKKIQFEEKYYSLRIGGCENYVVPLKKGTEILDSMNRKNKRKSLVFILTDSYDVNFEHYSKFYSKDYLYCFFYIVNDKEDINSLRNEIKNVPKNIVYEMLETRNMEKSFVSIINQIVKKK